MNATAINISHLDLIGATIETQYKLARIELFRGLDHLKRYTTREAFGASDFGHGHRCQPTYKTRVVPFDNAPDEIQAEVRAIDRLTREIVEGARCSGGTSIYYNTARCTCADGGGRELAQYTLRVSLEWGGRTLMREYVLGEVIRG